MKTPTWGYVIGIFMMLFGGCRCTSNYQAVMMPQLLEMQKGMMKTFTQSMPARRDNDTSAKTDDSITAQSSNHAAKQPHDDAGKFMDNVFYMSDFQKTWVVRFGYFGFIPTFIYIMAGIFLLIRRNFSIKLAYAALVFYIAFRIVQALILLPGAATGFITASLGMSNIFGVMVDVVFIIVISVSDKSAYRFENLPPPDQPIGQV
jgi:hypothetical protein